jgi:acyl carrier protein
MSALEMISQELTLILDDRGAYLGSIDADTLLLDGPLEIDSLDLATLVVALEERTGLKPFAKGFVVFHTAGDLAGLFTV